MDSCRALAACFSFGDGIVGKLDATILSLAPLACEHTHQTESIESWRQLFRVPYYSGNMPKFLSMMFPSVNFHRPRVIHVQTRVLIGQWFTVSFVKYHLLLFPWFLYPHSVTTVKKLSFYFERSGFQDSIFIDCQGVFTNNGASSSCQLSLTW